MPKPWIRMRLEQSVLADFVALVAVVLVRPGLARRNWELRQLSRRLFDGWASPHPTRQWEYPWVIQQLSRRLEPPGNIADYGAGRSPVPVYLVRAGFTVAVVDPDSGNTGSDTGNGGTTLGWQFTDYDQWGVETIKAGMEQPNFEAGTLSAGICISVIEHMPAQVRRQGLAEMAGAIQPGGFAVITVDLFADGSERLWNRAYRTGEVEPSEVHGTLDDFLLEASHVGLVPVQIDHSPFRSRRVRVAGLVFKRTELPSPTPSPRKSGRQKPGIG